MFILNMLAQLAALTAGVCIAFVDSFGRGILLVV